jgi:hypothetical protein
MENYNIEFKGIDLTVGGYYTEGERGDYDNRGTSSVFEIEEVCVIDSVVNIIDFFSADDLEVMSEKVIEFIED